MKYTIRELLDKVFDVNTVYKKFHNKFSTSDIEFVISKPEYCTGDFFKYLNDKFNEEIIQKIIDNGDLNASFECYRYCNKKFTIKQRAKYFDIQELFGNHIEEGIGYWMHPSGEVDKIDEDTHYEWIVNNKSDLENYISDDSEIYNDDYKFTYITDELSIIADTMLEDGWVRIRHINNEWTVYYGSADMETKINDFILEHIKKNEIVTYDMGENSFYEGGLFGSKK
jgi:hypothetical protein